MPLIGFRCPPSAPTAGTENPFAWCIRSCPHQCLPSGVLHTIHSMEHTNVHKGDMVSPTALPRCPRKLILTRTTDYYADPTLAYFATRGSLYHGFLECPGLEGVRTEARLYKTITKGACAPWVLTGQMDYYDIARRRLEDYKTLADKGLPFLWAEGPKEDHIQQLSIYRWLMDGGRLDSPEGQVIHWPVDTLQIHYILMNTVVSTGRPHTTQVYAYDGRDPKTYRYEIARRPAQLSPRGCQIWDITYLLPPPRALSDLEVEEILLAKGPTLVHGFREPAYMPPSVKHDKDARWECRYCPVVAPCDTYDQQAYRQAKAQLDLLTFARP